jgi:Family of unknown function (DUF6644)
MSLDDILSALEDWPLGMAVNESEFWFPFVESIHVLSFAFMVGSIFFVDLRLLGFIGKGNPVRQASRILPFTWGAFAVACVSGVLMFAPAASRYVVNPAFQLKFILMGLAGLNMLVFHYGVWRSVAAWDQGIATPPAAKFAGFLSMACWVGVVISGRVVPFLT